MYLDVLLQSFKLGIKTSFARAFGNTLLEGLKLRFLTYLIPQLDILAFRIETEIATSTFLRCSFETALFGGS